MALLAQYLAPILSLICFSLFTNTIAALLPETRYDDLSEDFFSQQNHQLDVPPVASQWTQLSKRPVFDLDKLRYIAFRVLGKDDQDRTRPAPHSGDTLEPGVERTRKRVFCNSFTGCGGRFRGRRRQLQQSNAIGKRPFSKRPFCNTLGCFNGRKRHAIGVLPQGVIRVPGKRLFCNGYGGCQNLGKRALLSRKQAFGEEVVEADGDKLDHTAEDDALKLKRFFNGLYDHDMAAVKANGKR